MPNRIVVFLLGLLLLALAAPALAAEAPVALAGRIQKKYAAISAFTADFSQGIKNAASGDVEKRSGTFAFKKPLLVRWDTVKPEKELLIVGKTAVWDYFEEDKEAYKYPVEEIIGSKTMLRFLTGKANLAEDFQVTADTVEKPGPGQTVLLLVPKEAEPGLVMAKVWMNTDTDLIERVLIQDFYANSNDLTLSNLTVNPKLADDLFAFTPPKGVTVHDNTAGKGPQGRELTP